MAKTSPITNTAFLVFPNQLFWPTRAVAGHEVVCLVEEPLFFGDKKYPLKHHWQKLILMRAAMSRYQKLVSTHTTTEYVAHPTSLDEVMARLANAGIKRVIVYDPTDDILNQRLTSSTHAHGIELNLLESPNFMTSTQLNADFATGKHHFSQTSYYIWQRKRLRLLLEHSGPAGGKWSFDTDNRGKLPESVALPTPSPTFTLKDHDRIYESLVKAGVKGTGDPGDGKTWQYPSTPKQASLLLKTFVETRLENFGSYQDALSERSDSLFHSLLSSSLNLGLLHPDQVVREVMTAYHQQSLPLNSVEGFIRQVVGWREYVRLLYLTKGRQLRTSNYFNHQRRLGPEWYDGTTGIPVLDEVINTSRHSSYAHHIERLMVVGNIMLLCEVHPDSVYQWFMEHYIDAYDWVMVPNVYGMSQFAAGPLMTTKPYLSGSRYLKSQGVSGGDWEQIVDGLYWRFLSTHTTFLKANPRMSLMVSVVSKMPKKTLERHIEVAEAFIHRVTVCDDKNKR